MHRIEGVITIVAGVIVWMIATDRFPADLNRRKEMEIRIPWVKNKKLLWSLSVFLWLFGCAVVLGIFS